MQRRPADRRRRRCRRRLWRRRLPDRQPMYSGKMRRRFGSPVSTTRKSPTSAWRRSISSTKKTKETPGLAYNWPLCGQGAAADTVAEAAEAAAAFAPAALEAAALEAAAGAALEAAAAAAASAGEAAAAAAAAASAGSAAAACRGEVAHSARLERLAIALTDARRHARV